MNEETFLKLISELGIQLSEKQRETLKKYSEKLLNYNKHTNLTAIKTIEEVYLKQFYDSLTLIKIRKSVFKTSGSTTEYWWRLLYSLHLIHISCTCTSASQSR